ncbi:hypothetical protein DFQ28_008088 [Apophysomyces sp. BC1034]|nr:hypothetical protein DFQ30_007765 [Apophysomyces sp. BC1015]KAG0176610.1 hypothetical protein DFQ29_005894 [Apophysomyces sp. BC1021]KAG0186263.1 hypothetical protein DFQ28_008088 [Apophysomyces sp. BC1034]
MVVHGHNLTPWKSADNLTTRPNNSHDLRKSRLHRRSACQPDLCPDEQPQTPLTQRPRKISFSRTPSMPSTPTSPRPTYASEVIMTHTINKDYDPTTGRKIINKFLFIKEIGRGVHGKVKLAENIETGELIAIKIVDKRSRRRQLVYSLLRGNSQQQMSNENKKSDSLQYRESEQKIQREIAILKRCAHPNVVKLREVIDDPSNRKIYMALEYIERGEIEWRDDSDRPVLSIDQSRRIFRNVVSGLDYIHYQGIIHRDIKPANILLSKDYVAKISDFGVSYFNEYLAGDTEASNESISRMDRDLAETAGTPAFFAPELCCAGDPPLNTTDEDAEERSGKTRPRISKAIDVWALGVTLYCFVFGCTPFTAATEFELFDIIPTEPVVFPDPDEVGFDVSDQLKDLLQKLLEKNPEERITLDEVKRHPWVIEDLDNPETWWKEADPQRYKPVEVTDEETTIMVWALKDQLRNHVLILFFFVQGSTAKVVPETILFIIKLDTRYHETPD